MLNILQYLSLIAAFIVPWMIGSIVKFAKLGDKKKVTVISVVLAVCILVIALCVTLAFKLSGAASYIRFESRERTQIITAFILKKSTRKGMTKFE